MKLLVRQRKIWFKMNEINESILYTAKHNLECTAKRIGLDKAILNKIALPKEKIEFRLSPALRNGQIVNIEAYIARHSDILGPSKGGIRMTRNVTMDEVVGLSMGMTWKTSLIGVPFGGGKSGIRFNPDSVSSADKEIIIRSFARSAKRHFGPELYIPAPDMGTDEIDMGHIRDCISYSEGFAITKGCFVTGKPIILGGIPGRREATGKGVVCTILAACKKLNLNIEGLKIAVQGFGNVGYVAALELARQGAKIIAVSDLSGGVVSDKGIDVELLYRYVQSTGGVRGFSKAVAISKEEFFEVKCDCLVPAAAGSQITKDNANNIKARIIAEGANAPTTSLADEILNEKGIFVIPDILCNAGGVFVSYLEYVQETQHEQMTQSQVETRLFDRMRESFNRVYEYSKQNKVTMREASMDIAVNRVVEGVNARGLLP